MTRTISLVSALVALLIGTSSALAQGNTGPDPVDVAARCVAQMDRTSENTVRVVANQTRASIARIRSLAAEGAPDRAIIAAGQAGADRLAATGRRGAGHVTRIESHCVDVLIRLGADRTLIARVRAAAEGSREAIGSAVRRGTAAIRQAVADAIG